MSGSAAEGPTDSILPVLDGFDADEVLEVICSHYGEQALWYELGEDGAFELCVPSQEAALSIRGRADFDGVRLERVAKSPHFEQIQWDRCLAAIEESIVGSSVETWHAICFQQYPVDGMWRSDDGEWGILAAPADFLRPRFRVLAITHSFWSSASRLLRANGSRHGGHREPCQNGWRSSTFWFGARPSSTHQAARNGWFPSTSRTWPNPARSGDGVPTGVRSRRKRTASAFLNRVAPSNSSAPRSTTIRVGGRIFWAAVEHQRDGRKVQHSGRWGTAEVRCRLPLGLYLR